MTAATSMHQPPSWSPVSSPSTAPPSPPVEKPVQFTLITSSPALTATLAAVIQSHVSTNDALPRAPFEDMTVFHALEPPAISVSDYVARVSKYVFCSEACLVAAYHYVITAISRHPNLALTSLSVHRLFITAVVLACKYFDDLSYNLLYYSKVGGLPHEELANLEFTMLSLLDFRLDISAHQFSRLESNLMAQLPPLHSSSPYPHVVHLARTALSELSRANLTPIVFQPLDTSSPPSPLSAPHDNRKSLLSTRCSPATSACTDSDPSLSRNSSLNSVSDRTSKQNGKPVVSHSPTTPVSTFRSTDVDTVTSAC